MYNELYGFHLDPMETTVARKEALYLSKVDEMKPIESVLFHVLEAHGRIPLAIVSGSPRASDPAAPSAFSAFTDRFADHQSARTTTSTASPARSPSFTAASPPQRRPPSILPRL